MFLLMGSRAKTKILGKTKPYTCGRCHNVSAWNVCCTTVWFTLFLIPIFPTSHHYYEQCPICGGYNDLTKEEAYRLVASTSENEVGV